MNPDDSESAEFRDLLPATYCDAIDLALQTHVKPHGDAPRWRQALTRIPRISDADVDFSCPAVTARRPIPPATQEVVHQALREFMPWRKGPFDLLDVFIDAEWRSDWKWQRLQPHISPLSGRVVLDVGCGNGYYLYRMLGEGANLALGVDPTRLFLYQFRAVQRLMPENTAFLLPLKGEQLPAMPLFDTVFSMGVLYHRRSPFDHLQELLQCLRPGGELVLETLVVPGNADTVLLPEARYAMMANVWLLPSTLALCRWLARLGFNNIRLVDETRTSTEEQRRTDWMSFQSLADFLDPKDNGLTIEGHPAPTRAIVLATRPE